MPPSYNRVRAVVRAYCRGQTDRQTHRHTDTQTRVATIHFASSTSTTHAKCKNTSACFSEGLMQVAAWYRGTPTPNCSLKKEMTCYAQMPLSSRSLKRCARKSLQFFLHHSVFWRTKGPPVSTFTSLDMMVYSKAPYIKLPNFVPF